MGRPYSQDFRERAVALVSSGQSRRAVSRLFGVGEATVIRWMRRQTDTGQCAAKPMGGRRPCVLRPEQDRLIARMAAAEFTIRQLRAELAARDVRVSYDAVWRFVRNQRLTFKKNSARRRAGPAGRRPQARPMAAPSAPD